jgi:hypothetical protein
MKSEGLNSSPPAAERTRPDNSEAQQARARRQAETAASQEKYEERRDSQRSEKSVDLEA